MNNLIIYADHSKGMSHYSPSQLEVANEITVSRHGRKNTKCPKSPYMNGWHMTGTVPISSLLDGALPGDSAISICLYCGKTFNQSNASHIDNWFIPKKQPNKVG